MLSVDNDSFCATKILLSASFFKCRYFNQSHNFCPLIYLLLFLTVRIGFCYFASCSTLMSYCIKEHHFYQLLPVCFLQMFVDILLGCLLPFAHSVPFQTNFFLPQLSSSAIYPHLLFSDVLYTLLTVSLFPQLL